MKMLRSIRAAAFAAGLALAMGVSLLAAPAQARQDAASAACTAVSYAPWRSGSGIAYKSATSCNSTVGAQSFLYQNRGAGWQRIDTGPLVKGIYAVTSQGSAGCRHNATFQYKTVGDHGWGMIYVRSESRVVSFRCP
jgi:hypothetical protein